MISLVLQIYFYLFIYVKVLAHKPKKNNRNIFPFSIIIAGRNEEENIKNFLPKILSQKYTEFEVIFINDRSDDNSIAVLNELKEQYQRLQIINLDKKNEIGGKKSAVTRGILSSKFEHLIFIDADTYPVSENLITDISNTYHQNTEIVLGYGAYEKRPGFLNKLIRFDTLFIALQYFSFAKTGMPYMGTGRNLSYKKSLFLKNKGFNSHQNLLSGDDDLFINQAAGKHNTEIVLNPESFTVSIPKLHFKEWFYQKRRHLTTGKRYKKKHIFYLGLELMSRFLFYLLCFIVLIDIDIGLGLIILFLGLTLKYIIISIFARKVKEKGIGLYILIFDIIIPMIHLFAVIKNSFIKIEKWK